MDFGSILQTAKQNDYNKKQSRYYSTKFSPPKKEEKKAKCLSANIQKFLARKEAEEKVKERVANKKRDDLLLLRSKDKKATRRVNVMLKRTKSANQSVIEDAVDKNNTAVTLAGPSQPDEDDYGYVSQEASAFYNKMMERYNKMPDDPKFSKSRGKASSNLMSTKDRVRAALEKEKEDALLPHKRKRKHKELIEEDDDKICEPVEEEKSQSQTKSKSKLKPPPPAMNFSDLLKLAAQKQHEPIVIEVKPKEEEGPLLTKKQKKEQELIQQQRDRRIPGKSNSVENKKAEHPTKPNSMLKQKLSENQLPKSNNSIRQIERIDKLNRVNNTQPKSESTKVRDKNNPSNNSNFVKKSNTAPGTSIKPQHSFPKPTNSLPRQKQPSSDINLQRSSKIGDKINPLSKSSLQPTKSLPEKQKINKPMLNIKHPSAMSNKPKLDGRPIQPKPSPSINVNQSKNTGPKLSLPTRLPVRQDHNGRPVKNIKSKPTIGNKRRIIDDDEEYDSEMDDFIDDGPEAMEDYSSYIKDIFGYDKSKYRGLDEDDVDNMETTFAQQMKEDIRSTKLGIMEDLEDIKREKEEKRRKDLLKKKRKL